MCLRLWHSDDSPCVLFFLSWSEICPLTSITQSSSARLGTVILEMDPDFVHFRRYSLSLIKASATYYREGTRWNLEMECHGQGYLGYKKSVGEVCFGFIFEIYEHLWDSVPFHDTFFPPCQIRVT